MDDVSPKTAPKPPTRSGLEAGHRDFDRPRRSIWGRLILLLIVVLIIGGVTYRLLEKPAQTQAPGFRSSGPLPVGVATVSKGSIDVELTALGTVTALTTVTVQTQVTGQLIDVGFREGQDVKQGDLLAEIDPRSYQAALDQAQGQLLKDQALLNEAQIDFNRYKTLAAQNSIARQQADDQEYVVEQDKGTVKVDEAQVNMAKINLGYTRITAPIAGRIGLRLVDPGNYVQANAGTSIAVITQLQPITVVFALPEDDLPRILKRLHAGAQLSVTAFDRAGTTKLADGILEAVDSTINTSTGTVNLKAVFANTDDGLFPNQFVNVNLLVDTVSDTLVIPTSAIQRGSPGTFVYLVQGEDTVAVRPIKLGPTQGEQVAVTDGLQAGDRIVVDGADKLRDGSKVTVHEKGKASAPAPASDTAAPAAGEHHHRQKSDDSDSGQSGAPAKPGSGQ